MSVGGWKTGNLAMNLFTQESGGTPRSPTVISGTAAHEFGHVLGLSDAYAADNYKNDPTLRPPASTNDVKNDGVMRDHRHGINITDKDMQMVIYAWNESTAQSYTTYGNVTRSSALDK